MTELTQHLSEFRLLLRGGHLWKKDGWREVVEHQAVQFYAIGVLADLLELPKEDKDKIRKVALVHDWQKRMEIKPDEFTDEDREEAGKYFEKVKPDNTLMKATGSDFMGRALNGNPSFLEYVQFYVDDISMGGKIVPLNERLDELEKRKQSMNEDSELTKSLGGRKYWDVEREIGHRAENMVFKRLKEKGVEVDSPSQIPLLLKARLPK